MKPTARLDCPHCLVERRRRHSFKITSRSEDESAWAAKWNTELSGLRSGATDWKFEPNDIDFEVKIADEELVKEETLS